MNIKSENNINNRFLCQVFCVPREPGEDQGA